ncbi:sugar phosphate isomerase/epimerase [Candidatus Methylospira mobilis]|uniref:Sugar phosphate isomerase/epimerase n=1 Tax=Candidatus Methylospira mobilis TaxID=1808979 RepID=A0A5Q0BI68_9GAMM|nr:sugar phosphate isomerase/epimerase family protein [Candidatus Methylospira mobilis]QFY41516.1 sugar phosphate isomerase/epimerase [Candidatus Methylospira mobilis]WNV05248.1 sugar phosphate isomerase/epimerase family protein [Candidatus Methylospira mobilis]
MSYKLAVSSLALPVHDTLRLLPQVGEMGVRGLEVSPEQVWRGNERKPAANEVTSYRREVETAGLTIIGLHGLLSDRPGLGVFAGPEALQRTVEYLTGLSSVCRDLGGRTLVIGGSRWRGDLSIKQAWNDYLAFFERLLPRIEDHGTVLCIEPLGPGDADFCSTAAECRMLTGYIDHPALGLQLNAKAQVENNDAGHAPFSAARGRLEHFHANEPGFAALGSSGRVDHADFRRHLSAITYREWVCLAQKVSANPLQGLLSGIRHLKQCYLREGNQGRQRLIPVRATG